MNKNLLKLLAVLWLIIVALSATTAWGQTPPRIYRNNIEGTNPSSQNPFTAGEIKDANITASGIFRGSGLAASVANESFRAVGWNSTTFDANDYFEWTMTPNSGYAMNFTQLFLGQSAEGGQRLTSMRTSLDNFTATVPESPLYYYDLSGAQFQNVTTPITFRLYVWNAASATNQYGIDFFTFFGTVSATASTPGFEPHALKYYPNPVKDIFTLSHTPDITDIAVYNMLGQQVLSRTVNAAEATIDMSHLNAGTYFVKVSSAGGKKNIKVIKQ